MFLLYYDYNNNLEENIMKFGERLRYYREKAGKSQKELAAAVGIPFQTYNNYEVKGNEPKIEVLIKIAEVLKIDVNTLVGFNDSLYERSIRTYTDVTGDFLIWTEEGYIHIWNGTSKFLIPHKDLESIVYSCQDRAEKQMAPVLGEMEKMKRQYFCNILAKRLGEYELEHFKPAPDTAD